MNIVDDLNFQEALEGKIIVKTQSSISHYGIRLTVKGSVNLQVPSCFIVQKMMERWKFYAQNHSFFEARGGSILGFNHVSCFEFLILKLVRFGVTAMEPFDV